MVDITYLYNAVDITYVYNAVDVTYVYNAVDITYVYNAVDITYVYNAVDITYVYNVVDITYVYNVVDITYVYNAVDITYVYNAVDITYVCGRNHMSDSVVVCLHVSSTSHVFANLPTHTHTHTLSKSPPPPSHLPSPLVYPHRPVSLYQLSSHHSPVCCSQIGLNLRLTTRLLHSETPPPSLYLKPQGP